MPKKWLHSSDVPQVDVFDAEVMGDVAGLEKGWLWSGAYVGETVAREETAEMERDILEAVVHHPATEGRDLLFGVVQAGNQQVGDFHVNASGVHRKDVF